MNGRPFFATCVIATILMLGSAAFAAEPPPTPTPTQPKVSADYLSLTDALRAAQAAINACAAQGLHPAVVVMDAEGYIRASLSDDGANLTGIISSNRKAAAVLTFKTSTRDLMTRMLTDKQFADQYSKDTRFHFMPGGYPIFRDGKFVAVIAVGGAHITGDDECARVGLRSLPWASAEAKISTDRK